MSGELESFLAPPCGREGGAFPDSAASLPDALMDFLVGEQLNWGYSPPTVVTFSTAGVEMDRTLGARATVFLLPLLTLIGVQVIVPPDACADLIAISDSTFAPGDWSSEVLLSTNGATHSAEQLLMGGDPDAFRHMFFDMDPGPAAILVFHQFLGTTYEPSTQGAIDSIDYSESQIQFNPPFSGAIIGANPALLQDGHVFIGPSLNFMNLSWQSARLANLIAADFGDTVHPDFSSGGSPIHFGYIRQNSTNSSGISTEHGIDNWRFELMTSVPEPTRLWLLVGGLIAVRLRRAIFTARWRWA